MKMNELELDTQIELWMSYKERVMDDYQLTEDEAEEWADEFMNFDFNINK